MFTLLSPISLWFGAVLAVPLMIHFLGRQRLQRKPFPSLLLVRERFSKSMHRHRLKNLLLLILRTLLILCLLLALANPALESRQASAKPDLSLALVHNGIYGRLHPGGTGPGWPASDPRPDYDAGGSRAAFALEAQWSRLRALDSSLGLSTRILPVIADGPGPREVSERFGDYGEGLARLLAEAGSGSGTGSIQMQLPVFSWRELAASAPLLQRALRENPGLQLALTDFSAGQARLNAFAGLRATAAPDAPTLAVQARLSPAAAAIADRIRVTLDGRPFQDAPANGSIVEVTLPMGEGAARSGRFSLPAGGFAAPDLHFCFPETGNLLLAHSGSALASLPSLGRESYFRRISHASSAKDIQWDGAYRKGSDAPAAKGARRSGSLRLAYLAAERGASQEAYSRAVEFVKRGGRLIIGVGRESDIPLLNRFLLQPLRLGRLGNLSESAAGQPVSADRAALAGFGRIPLPAGTPGTVRKRFAYEADSGAAILLFQGDRSGAILAARDFQRGKALLWTTDIDDLDWTDLGVSPLTPLLHQAFGAGEDPADGGAGSRNENRTVASDSIYGLSLDRIFPGAGAPGAGSGAGAEAGGGTASVTVLDPEGKAFTKVRRDGDRLRLGPFDKLGIHRIASGKDTFAFAVNLAQAPIRDGEDSAQAEFLDACKAFPGRVQVLRPSDPAGVRASVRRVWPALLLAAILLLLLEGLISATFSLRRNRP